MRISDWSSDVCSSDLDFGRFVDFQDFEHVAEEVPAIGAGVALFPAAFVDNYGGAVGRSMDWKASGHDPLMDSRDIFDLQRNVRVAVFVDAAPRVRRGLLRGAVLENLDLDIAEAAEELVGRAAVQADDPVDEDRKRTRLNSSH